MAVNGLAGGSVGAVSHKYPNDIVPDGWAFSIWGIIYTLLMAFCVWQCCAEAKTVVKQIGWAFVASNIFNACWIKCFVYKDGVPVTVVISSVLLFLLLTANWVILYRAQAWQRAQSESTWLQALLVDATFSIYTSWATVASIVNVAAAGVALGAGSALLGLSGAQWSAALLLVAAIVNGAVLLRRRDPVYPLVFVWAALAIRTGHAGDHSSLVPHVATVLAAA
eukprot:SAG11_NODE_9001_length_955_cov_0.864486_1_plen_222_part_01